MSATHVVVLAAGRGSRLTALREEQPKWLLEVGGRTLAERHLEGIARAGDAVASVRVVTGYGAHTIERFLAGRRPRPPVVPVFNPEWAELNNWWSVLRGLRDVPDDSGGVAVVNSDLLVDPGWLASFLADVAAGDAGGRLATDFERVLTDESMKVSQTPAGDLDRIGKVGVDAPVGEYIGMLHARGDVLAAFRAQLERFVGDPAAANEWYEGAVGRSAAEGHRWRLWPTPGTAWVEIDDDGDLARAGALDGA